MEDYEKYSLKELKALSYEYHLKPKGTRKADYLAVVQEYFEASPSQEKADVPTDKIILKFPGPIYNPELGRVEKGFHLFEKEQADRWLAVAKRVKVADPGEVAAYYGA